jgi:hypothetical protein
MDCGEGYGIDGEAGTHLVVDSSSHDHPISANKPVTWSDLGRLMI